MDLLSSIVKDKLSVVTGFGKGVTFNSNYKTLKTAQFRTRKSLMSPMTSKLTK
jgi:hypothetical protein